MSIRYKEKVIVREPTFLYFAAFVGAAIYYIQQAEGFWMGVVGFLKACVWPGFLVYELLGFLGA
jgi:hypothetical protein